VKGIGEDDRDNIGVIALTEESSDGGDEKVPCGTGVEAPED
jgi:hypothetical protein